MQVRCRSPSRCACSGVPHCGGGALRQRHTNWHLLRASPRPSGRPSPSLRPFPPCPLQAMLRPAYAAIGQHARDGQPAIVFVPTRKHAKMAALDLLTHAAADGAPHKFRQVGGVEPVLLGGLGGAEGAPPLLPLLLLGAGHARLHSGAARGSRHQPPSPAPPRLPASAAGQRGRHRALPGQGGRPRAAPLAQVGARAVGAVWEGNTRAVQRQLLPAVSMPGGITRFPTPPAAVPKIVAARPPPQLPQLRRGLPARDAAGGGAGGGAPAV